MNESAGSDIPGERRINLVHLDSHGMHVPSEEAAIAARWVQQPVRLASYDPFDQ